MVSLWEFVLVCWKTRLKVVSHLKLRSIWDDGMSDITGNIFLSRFLSLSIEILRKNEEEEGGVANHAKAQPPQANNSAKYCTEIMIFLKFSPWSIARGFEMLLMLQPNIWVMLCLSII